MVSFLTLVFNLQFLDFPFGSGKSHLESHPYFGEVIFPASSLPLMPSSRRASFLWFHQRNVNSQSYNCLMTSVQWERPLKGRVVAMTLLEGTNKPQKCLDNVLLVLETYQVLGSIMSWIVLSQFHFELERADTGCRTGGRTCRLGRSDSFRMTWAE